MNKTTRNILLTLLALFLLAGSFSAGVIVGWLIPSQSPMQANVTATVTAEDNTTTLFKPFWQAWDILHQNYIDQPLNDTLLMQGAIRGMVDSLGDSHTLYMTQAEYNSANVSLTGKYGGIGAYVSVNGAFLTITGTFEGSPAEKAGLKAGDEIIAVDGKDVTGIDPSVVLESVKGDAGTSVVLTIHRSNPESTFDVTITRETITYKTVTGKILTQADLPSNTSLVLNKNIAYIRLSSFGQETAADLKTTLTTLLAENPKGIILDLRENGGGYLETAVDVVSQFVSEGVVVYQEDNSGNLTAYNATSGGLATEIPLVILVDGNTASASEITAGAIQDYGRGVLVGTQTYGKGSVQYWIPLDNNQGAVAVTISRWLTPLKHQIDKVGLTPDFVVKLTDEDVKMGYDLQLEKAVEILLQGAQ
jgi:carboxyl-terminal processing protease